VETTIVECRRCGKEKTAYGTHGRSKKRALALLNENCPRGENNFYEVDESARRTEPWPLDVGENGCYEVEE